MANPKTKKDAPASAPKTKAKPSFIADARKSLKIMLDGAKGIPKGADYKKPGRSAIVRQFHPEWPNPTAWAIGHSLIEAKLIMDLLPEDHVMTSQMTYRDEPSVLLAELTEISEAAWPALFAWTLSGGECGPVKLVPTEKHPSSKAPFIGKELFAAVLAKRKPIFEDAPVLIEQQSSLYRFPSRFFFGESGEQVALIAAALPKAHVKKLHLQTINKDASKEVVLADITLLSVPAFFVVRAWLEAGAPENNPAILKQLMAVADAHSK